eukprot:gnl/Spiro4/15278_TR8199_c0_g1_i1.p1 gnl/Spiro4/15278_TR8199_c0_g1~~gnl/Spiro4/15278_TR8199_c0_g1_i1.p1  ORF type:complete len:516 (+),score=49.49 gnl/Spiro4/15278_TR8199_c0_g1_i1:83-1549(+)
MSAANQNTMPVSAIVTIVLRISAVVVLSLWIRWACFTPHRMGMDDTGLVTNYDGSATARPRYYVQPLTEEEIIVTVKSATNGGRKIKVIGSGHSFVDIAMSDDMMMNLDKYASVVAIDTSNKTITVQAGIRLKDLMVIMDQHGLALANKGTVSEQSIAGAISTGTHGSGLQTGIMATQVIALRIITAQGEVIVASRSQNVDVFEAARVSVGALGIISEVTIQCVSAYNMRKVETRMSMREFSSHFEQNVHSPPAPYWSWMGFPHSNCDGSMCGMLIKWGPTDEELPEPNAISEWFDSKLMLLFRFILAPTVWIPSTTRFIMNYLVASVALAEKSFVDRWPRGFSMGDYTYGPLYSEMEVFIPVEMTVEALNAVEKFLAKENMVTNFPLSLRFVMADDIWLSPAYGRASAIFSLSMHRREAHRADFHCKLLREVFAQFEGRTHWGKNSCLSSVQLSALYPQWDKFAELRNKMDPKRTFENPYLKRMLGP